MFKVEGGREMALYVVVEQGPTGGVRFIMPFDIAVVILSHAALWHASDRRVFHFTCSIDKYTDTTTATYHPRNISKSTHLPPTMLHKRKRSSTTLLSSPTSDLPGSSSTVQSFYPHTKPILSPFHSPAIFPHNFKTSIRIRGLAVEPCITSGRKGFRAMFCRGLFCARLW